MLDDRPSDLAQIGLRNVLLFDQVYVVRASAQLELRMPVANSVNVRW